MQTLKKINASLAAIYLNESASLIKNPINMSSINKTNAIS
jgi:hypothetical protein